MRYLDGTPCDLRAALVRTAFRFVDAFPGIYLIGGFAIAGTKRRQRIGDQAAGTSVYRRSEFVVRRLQPGLAMPGRSGIVRG